MQKIALTLASMALIGCASPPHECPEPLDSSVKLDLPDRGIGTPVEDESPARDAWVVFKYVFWGHGSREDLPWWE
jgi:hypothetical protein